MSLQSIQTETAKPAFAELFPAPSSGQSDTPSLAKKSGARNAQRSEVSIPAGKTDESGDGGNSFAASLQVAAAPKSESRNLLDNSAETASAIANVDTQQPKALVNPVQVSEKAIKLEESIPVPNQVGQAQDDNLIPARLVSGTLPSVAKPVNLAAVEPVLGGIQKTEKSGASLGAVEFQTVEADQVALKQGRLVNNLANNHNVLHDTLVNVNAQQEKGAAQSGLLAGENFVQEEIPTIEKSQNSQILQKSPERLALDALVQEVVRDYTNGTEKNTLRTQLSGLSNFGSVVRQTLTNHAGERAVTDPTITPMSNTGFQETILSGTNPVLAVNSAQSDFNSLRQSFGSQSAIAEEVIANNSDSQINPLVGDPSEKMLFGGGKPTTGVNGIVSSLEPSQSLVGQPQVVGAEGLGGSVEAVELNTLDGSLWQDSEIELSATKGAKQNGLRSGASQRVSLVLPRGFAQQVRAGADSITLKLSPASLGDAKLTLSLVNDQLSGSLLVESVAAKSAVENSLNSLIERLNGEGLSLEKLDVEVANQQGEQERFNEALEQNGFGRGENRLAEEESDAVEDEQTPLGSRKQIISASAIDAVA